NSVQVFFRDGTDTGEVSIDYPIGHRKRRAEGIPVLMQKFERAIRGRLPPARADRLMALANNPQAWESLAVTEVIGLFRPEGSLREIRPVGDSAQCWPGLNMIFTVPNLTSARGAASGRP